MLQRQTAAYWDRYQFAPGYRPNANLRANGGLAVFYD